MLGRVRLVSRLSLFVLMAVTACAPTSPASQADGRSGVPEDAAARTIVLAQTNPVTSFGPWQFGNTSGGAGSLVEVHTTGLTVEDAYGGLAPEEPRPSHRSRMHLS
jgi:hypothetical protein